jgi:excisionase family DNA binding protein
MTEQILFSLPLERLEPIFKGWVRDVLLSSAPPPSDHDQDDILTVEEAAVFLKVKRPTIYGYLYNKQIPSVKKRGRVYFRKSTLLEWLGEGQRMTKNEITQAAAESLVSQ